MFTALTLWVIGWTFTHGAYSYLIATNAKSAITDHCGPPSFVGTLFLWPLVLGALWIETK